MTSPGRSRRLGWPGRHIAIIGSRATVTVSGSTFQSRFGLRSRLFTVTGASPTATPQAATRPRSTAQTMAG